MSQLLELIAALEQKYKLNTDVGVTQGARKIRKGITGKRITFFSSYKNQGRVLACEGDLEFRHCLKLEFDHAIESYYLQPFTLKLPGMSYTPDNLHKTASGKYVITEVKPYRESKLSSVKNIINTAHEYCLDQGVGFRLVTENELGSDIEHLNRERINQANPELIPPKILKYIKHKLGGSYRAPVTKCREILMSDGFDANIIESLLYSGFLTFEPDLLFSEWITVWSGP